jgi:broad specificity phosphatase PhoE
LSAAGVSGAKEIVLVRHAETEWSLDGRHTGRTDIPLTDNGRAAARALAQRLRAWHFDTVLVSPLTRARETCELCGLGAGAQSREALLEWDYGAYEGRTTLEIQSEQPGWMLWRDGCPDGEDAAAVGARADSVIAELRSLEGTVAIFSHGHMLRVLGARWIDLDPSGGAHLGLSTCAVCVLDHERQTPMLWRWNETASGPAPAAPEVENQ